MYFACCRLVTAAARFQTPDRPRGIFMRNTALGTVFLPALLFSPVSTIPPMLHIRLHLNATVIRRTSGRRVEPSKKAMIFFVNQGTLDRKVLKFSEGYTATLR
jgi:hypothetical protein